MGSVAGTPSCRHFPRIASESATGRVKPGLPSTIPQNLRIKSFFGTSPNAVKTQVWIAVCVYVLVAIIKKQLNLPESLHKLLQVLSVNPFEKVTLLELLTQDEPQANNYNNQYQLMLFDL